MWTKIIDLVIAWAKERPRTGLVSKVIALRDAMSGCDAAYHRYAQARDAGAEFDELRTAWRHEFGRLEVAMTNVDEVLHIFGADARRTVRGYLLSEAEPSAEDGETVATAALKVSGRVPDSPQETTAKVDFPEALARLDEFIRLTFKPEEIVAARQRFI